MQKGLVRHRRLFEDFQTPNACGQRAGRPCLGTKPLPRPLIQGSDEVGSPWAPDPAAALVFSELGRQPPAEERDRHKAGRTSGRCKEPSRMRFAPGHSLPPAAHPSGTAGDGRGCPQTCAHSLLTSAPGRRCGKSLGGMPESGVRRQDTGLREGQRGAQGHTAAARVPRGVRCPRFPLDPVRGVTLRVQGAWEGLWFAVLPLNPPLQGSQTLGCSPPSSRLQVLAFGVGSGPPFLPPSSGNCLEGAFGAPGPRKLGICNPKAQASPPHRPLLPVPGWPTLPSPQLSTQVLCLGLLLGAFVRPWVSRAARALSLRSRVSPLAGRTLPTPEP